MVNSVVLNNGVMMPKMGLGTHTLKGRSLIKTVRAAYRIGYRNFDTAWLYQNEKSLKWALRFSGIKRNEIFITSKIEWRQLISGKSVEECLKGSLKRLGTDYIDLYLIHWPKPDMYQEMWKGLVKLYQAGYVRAIGVSSFLPEHIDTLSQVSEIVPAVNQIELHPLNNRRDVVLYCQQKGIQVEAHSPFARGSAASELMNNPVLSHIADNHGKTVAQVILKWILQQGIVTIPRSVHASRLKENMDVFDFELTIAEMQAIDALNQDKYFGGDPRRTLPFISKV